MFDLDLNDETTLELLAEAEADPTDESARVLMMHLLFRDLAGRGEWPDPEPETLN